MMPSLTVLPSQTKVLLLWLYSPLLYARNGYKTPFNSPELHPLFNQHLWLYCNFLKNKQTNKQTQAHNRYSINISEWKNEEIFCKCHLHSSISRHGLGVGNSPIFRNTSDLCAIVVFLLRLSQLSCMQMGALVMKISCPASLLCPVRNQSWHRKTGTCFTPRNVCSFC